MPKFEFSRDWNHAGEEHVAGDRVDLPEAKAEHLRLLGAGTVVNRPKVADASPPPCPSERKRKKHRK